MRGFGPRKVLGPGSWVLGLGPARQLPSLDTERDNPYLGFMNVELTPDQLAFMRQAIKSGRFRSEEEAVQQALALWEERERTRAEILAAVDDAETSLARGMGRVLTETSIPALLEDVKQRGRKRLAAVTI